MKILTEHAIRQLGITPQTCMEWIKESFSIKQHAQLPAKISVHPEEGEFFTSMPCLLPSPGVGGARFQRRYFGVKVVHRLLQSTPSLGSDLMLYDAQSGELLALVDTDWITTMRTGAVAALSSKVLRKSNAEAYGMVGLGNTARATLMCILAQEPERHFHVKLLRYKNQAELFIERFKDNHNVSFEIVDDAGEMARSVDVFISCITNAHGPRPREDFRQPAHHRLQLRVGTARRGLCRKNLRTALRLSAGFHHRERNREILGVTCASTPKERQATIKQSAGISGRHPLIPALSDCEPDIGIVVNGFQTS